MLYTHRVYEDCGAPLVLDESRWPKQPGAYVFKCPVCRRDIRIGVVQRFEPISPAGGTRGAKVSKDGGVGLPSRQETRVDHGAAPNLS